MAHASRPGTASPQQIARLQTSAQKAGVDDAWLLGLAKSDRNARRHSFAGVMKLSALATLGDLSMFEASSLISELENAAATGEKVRGVCVRCVRLGFVGTLPCMHDGAGTSDEQRRVQSFEHERGRW